jgi:peptidoglycan hydrolase-like protein with peptidoglycan-binding domain
VRRASLAAALALALAAGCRHPSKVGDGAGGGAAGASERPKQGEEPSPAQKGVPPRGETPRVPSSPKALLAEGAIADIQEALEARGYLGRHRAGELDDATSTALRALQRDEGLAETGFPDRETLRKLGIDPEKAYGKVSEETKARSKEEPRRGDGG